MVVRCLEITASLNLDKNPLLVKPVKKMNCGYLRTNKASYFVVIQQGFSTWVTRKTDAPPIYSWVP